MITEFKTALIKRQEEEYLRGMLPALADNKELQASFMEGLKAETIHLLFYHFYKKYELTGLPPEMTDEFRYMYKIEKANQLVKAIEVQKIIKALQGIDVIFLKGAGLSKMLSMELYKPSIDIDFLVKESDLKKVSECLDKMGYSRVSFQTRGEYSMVNSFGVCIDVHYEFIASAAFITLSEINYKELFKQKISLDIGGGASIPSMDINFNFIYLCLHFGINHQFNGFLLIYELKLYMDNYADKLDWKFILNYSRKHNLEVVVYLTLWILAKMNCHPPDGQFPYLLIKDANFRYEVDRFAMNHDISQCLLTGKWNRIVTNDVPMLTANTRKKYLKYIKGNKMWTEKKYA